MSDHPEYRLAQKVTLSKISLSTIPLDLFQDKQRGKLYLTAAEKTISGQELSIVQLGSLFDKYIQPRLKKESQDNWHSTAVLFNYMGCCIEDPDLLRIYANWYPRRRFLMAIPDLQSLLRRVDLPRVDAPLIELYGRPTQIDTAKTLKRLLDAASGVSRSEGLPTGFIEPLQDIIKDINCPVVEGYDRVIKLSPWLPTSIPRLLEGAAKSTLSETCAGALVNYGVDILPILNAAVDGTDSDLKEIARDMLKVLGRFNTDMIRLPSDHASDST